MLLHCKSTPYAAALAPVQDHLLSSEPVDCRPYLCIDGDGIAVKKAPSPAKAGKAGAMVDPRNRTRCMVSPYLQHALLVLVPLVFVLLLDEVADKFLTVGARSMNVEGSSVFHLFRWFQHCMRAWVRPCLLRRRWWRPGVWEIIAQQRTNSDGRVPGLMAPSDTLPQGLYTPPPPSPPPSFPGS